MAPNQLRKLDATSYHVAWICAVADIELTPALLMLDESHERPDIDNQYDDNTYRFGTMASHNVVIATCPDGMTGQVNVGYIVGPLFRTFTAIRMTLLVGIGGGVPQKNLFSQPLKDVRLGDVVVGWRSHADGKPAVVYYDSGRSLVDGFQTTTQLNRPDMVLLKALPFLRTDHILGQSTFHIYLDRLQRNEQLGDHFKHPGLEHDLLFKSIYKHVGGYNSYCVGCDKKNLVKREARTESQRERFIFHQGRIATGNSVIQDGEKRDWINEEYGDVFCIDMEAAGVDINSSCLVIRGISDYADSHKSDKWRSYAAGKAVVFARELLGKISPMDVKEKIASGNKHWLVKGNTNTNFTGRRQIINTILKRLTSENAANEQQRFVLTGMGGQGKSEICLHVANEVRDKFWGVFWVDVSTRSTAKENFAQVAEALECSKSVDAVQKTLSNLPATSKWLLILDNADDPFIDYKIYVPSGTRGAILITSRNPQCGHLATTGGHKELESLEESECIQLLQKTAGRQDVARGIKKHASAVSLVRHLGHHTLAILHAGSYIATTRCTAAEYLEFLRTNRRRLLERSRGQEQSRYDTVYATFGASIEFLERPDTGVLEETRTDSLQLLKVLSTFHYMNMPLDILMDAWKGVQKALATPQEDELYSDELTGWHVAQVPDLVKAGKNDVKLRVTEAVSRLKSLALVRIEQSGRVWKSVSMHPLVHSWASDRQGHKERKEVLRMTECIVALSEYAFTGECPYHFQFALHLKQLVESDVELVNDAAQSRCVLQVCVQIAWLYSHTELDRDMYEFTSRIFQQLGLHDQEPTVELRDVYRVFANAANGKRTHPAQAVGVFEAIAQLDEKTVCEHNRARLHNLQDLGVAYRRNGQTKKAIAVLGKRVKARPGHGEEPKDLLWSQHIFAMALLDDGQIKEAIALLGYVVNIEQRLYREDNPERFVSQQLLAVACLKDGQIAEATLRLEEVVRLNAQTLGEEHPITAIAQHSLAGAYEQAGRLSDAIALHERVVNTRRLAFGENHPDLLASQHDLAVAYLDDGRVQEAIDILERLFHIRDSTLDDTDGEKLASQHELGRAYLDDERVSDAIEILERVVNIRKSILEEKDPALLKSQHVLSQAYLEDGRVSEAIEILEWVVKVDGSLYEQGHPTRVVSQELLDEAYAMRDSSFPTTQTLAALEYVHQDPSLQFEEAFTPAATEDGTSVEGEEQEAELLSCP